MPGKRCYPSSTWLFESQETFLQAAQKRSALHRIRHRPKVATLSSSLAPEYPVEADAFCVKVRASARLFRVMYRVVKRPEVRRDRLFAELCADDVVEPATRVIQELAYMYTRHVPPVMHATIRKRARSRIINRVDRHNMPHQTTALVVRTTGTMAICDILGVGELQLP